MWDFILYFFCIVGMFWVLGQVIGWALGAPNWLKLWQRSKRLTLYVTIQRNALEIISKGKCRDSESAPCHKGFTAIEGWCDPCIAKFALEDTKKADEELVRLSYRHLLATRELYEDEK